MTNKNRNEEMARMINPVMKTLNRMLDCIEDDNEFNGTVTEIKECLQRLEVVQKYLNE